MTHVPDIAVAAIDLVCGCRNWNIAFFGVCNRVMPRLDVPFAPGGNDLELWSERFIGELEPHLIVAFAGATVRHGVCALRESYFHLPFGEQRPADRRTEQVLALVHRAGLDQRPEIFSYEFVSKVFDVALGCAGPDRLFFKSVELIILADVAGHGDDFTTIVFLEPRNDYGRVQAPRIRENDLLDLLIHSCSPQMKRELLFLPAT